MIESSCFKTKVISTWGQLGRQWLSDLPKIIHQLTIHWSLSQIKPVTNLSYNFVAFALQNLVDPVVIKISCDSQLIESERDALIHFKGMGAIQLIDSHLPLNALLIQQATPGLSLKEYQAENFNDKVNNYALVVSAISNQQLATHTFVHVSQWCQIIDNIQYSDIECHLIDKAKQLRQYLLGSSPKDYVCHGDLHLENIVQHDKSWLAIDPKGIIGEKAFEAAVFDFASQEELTAVINLREVIEYRISVLSERLGLDRQRLIAWVFLRAMISVQWFIDDKGSPEFMIEMVKVMYSLMDG